MPGIACDWVTVIDQTQCVGDSLDIINQNFSNLEEAICSLYSLFPPGMVILYTGSTAPSGWAICNGASLNTVTNATLFNVIHYTYGGSGATFKVPDLRGRTAIGTSTTHTLATSGGTETVSLTSGQNAPHTHGVTDPGHFHGATSAPHTHTTTNDSHSHGLNDPGHDHNVYYGANTLTGSTSAGAIPGNRIPTTQQINYGLANATSSTAIYQNNHSIGPYFNDNAGGAAANTNPHSWWFNSTNNGGTQLYFGDTASPYYFASVEAVTTANPLQVTMLSATSHVTINAAATNITINPATPTITVSPTAANITLGLTGSGNAHNNMQPYLCLNYIIKLF